jgi:hypothetical protein
MEDNMKHDKSDTTQTLPLLLVIMALVIWFSFQTVQLFKERQNLKTMHANQDQIIADAGKMRSQLDAIATGTQRLAEQNNTNAQTIVQQLAKSGISINAKQQAASAPNNRCLGRTSGLVCLYELQLIRQIVNSFPLHFRSSGIVVLYA